MNPSRGIGIVGCALLFGCTGVSVTANTDAGRDVGTDLGTDLGTDVAMDAGPVVPCFIDGGISVTQTVGPDGGTVSLSDGAVTLVVPPGALSTSIPITISLGAASPGPNYVAGSQVYCFSPQGTLFAAGHPATVTIDGTSVSSPIAGMDILWSPTGALSANQVALAGMQMGAALTGQVSHFSFGFVGRWTGPASGAPGCDPLVDMTSDPRHCGTCDNACPIPANGLPTCMGGACGITCTMGFVPMAGACVCPPGQTVCGSGSTAICTDTQNDKLNCGGCGMPCPLAGPNATSACAEGMCATMCIAPYAFCEDAICDIDLSADPNNCGDCAHVCGDAGTCHLGTCGSGG